MNTLRFCLVSVWIAVLTTALSACVTTRSEWIRQKEAQDLDRPAPPRAVPAPTALPSEAPAATPSPASGPLAAADPAVSPSPSPQPSPVQGPDLSQLSDDELRVELAKALGKNEELQRELSLKEQAKTEEIKRAEERIAALEKQLKELTPDTPRAPEGKTPFEAGKDAFAAGNWDEALAFFNQTLSGNEKGKIVEEATYLRGESYFRKLQYNKAIVDFSKFPEQFQKSPFHPKALLKIAESFESMGRKEEARMFYSELQEKFPKTAEGKIAKKKLSR